MLEYKNIGILSTDLTFFHKIIGGMRRTRHKRHSINVVDFVDPSQHDFRSILTKLKNHDYDAFGVFLLPGQVRSFYTQSAQLKVHFKTFGTDVFESRTEIAASGEAINGAFFPSVPLRKSFAERYQQAYGNDIQMAFGGNAYDFFSVIAKLLGIYDGKETFLAGIEKMMPIHGVTGKLELQDRGVSSPITIKEIRSNTVHPTSTLAEATEEDMVPSS